VGIPQGATPVGHKVTAVRFARVHHHGQQAVQILGEHRAEALAATHSIVHRQAGGIQRHRGAPGSASLEK